MWDKIKNFFESKNEVKELPALDELEIIKSLINDLNSSKFSNFNSNKNNLKKLRSQYETIGLYNKGLRQIVPMLNELDKLYSGNIYLNETVVSVSDFFVTEDKKYLDEELYVEEFINLALSYFEIIKKENTRNVIRNRKLSNYTNSLLNTLNDLFNLQNTI